MEIQVHPRVKKYLDKSGEKEKLKRYLRRLIEDPYTPRSGVDIKKLRGKSHYLYRLRVGDHRFEYFVEEDTIWIERALKRERGYR
jgi:mRNA-degrading endonuclease RelE of RelBE toxin-antitoxin system